MVCTWELPSRYCGEITLHIVTKICQCMFFWVENTIKKLNFMMTQCGNVVLLFQVSQCIGSHISLLVRDLIILFKDDYCQVLSGLINNLPDIVEAFSKVINPDKLTHSSDLLAALLSCEQVIFVSNDWRLQEQFIVSLSALTKLFSSDQIYNKLVPRVFDKLHHAVSTRLRPAT